MEKKPQGYRWSGTRYALYRQALEKKRCRYRQKRAPHVAKIRELAEAGLTKKEIAGRLGLKVDTVSNWCKMERIAIRRARRNDMLTDETIETIRELNGQGFPDSYIAYRIDRHPLTVYNWRFRLGLPANQLRRRFQWQELGQGEALSLIKALRSIQALRKYLKTPSEETRAALQLLAAELKRPTSSPDS